MEWPPRTSFAGQKRKADDTDSEEEANSRPAFGFRGFAPPSARSPSPINMNDSGRPSGQKPNMTTKGGGGKTKSGPSAGGNSFASRMMAKMGYVEGQGLGSGGQGMLNPIETVLRPQGVGLGAVKEKTQQAKDEAKRQAASRGETLVDSSDEEREQQKRRRDARKNESRSGTGTPKVQKPRYRTAREIETDIEGLEVPSVLKSLIDATGKEQKLLTSTAGLMAPEFVSADENETLKIARRARHDLEAFADEWKGLSERKKFVESEETQVMDELDSQQAAIERLTALTTTVGDLENLTLEDNLSTQWDQITQKLESLESEYAQFIDEYDLPEVAVAAIHSIFKKSMEEWEPIQNPSFLVSNLRRIHNLVTHLREGQEGRQKQTTTPYESLIYTLWLPRIRSAILNDWNVYDPAPAIALVETWKDVLPSFILSNVLDQLIVPKLTMALKEWKPQGSRKRNGPQSRESQFPWWLFDWLGYLDERHTDPKAPTGLLSDAKRKFRSVLDRWEISRGLLPGLELWKETLGSEFDTALRNHLLPRLARFLRERFEVNPQDQDLTVFEDVLKWKTFFKPHVLALLFSAEFFPKWHSILHLWLTSEPNYEEVGQWFSWWKTQIPEDINAVYEIQEEWNRGLEMMNLALDLGDKAATDLPAPVSQQRHKDIRGHVEHKPAVPTNGTTAEKPRPKQVEEPTFKDIVEEWCADEGLVMIPLREAHVQSGLPLFRITASANGKGGTLVYIKGDVVWAQNRKSREIWEPVGLDNNLVSRAEGK